MKWYTDDYTYTVYICICIYILYTYFIYSTWFWSFIISWNTSVTRFRLTAQNDYHTLFPPLNSNKWRSKESTNRWDRMRFQFEADTSKRSGCCVYRSSKDLTMISGTDLAADWLTTASQFEGEFLVNGSDSLFSISPCFHLMLQTVNSLHCMWTCAVACSLGACLSFKRPLM